MEEWGRALGATAEEVIAKLEDDGEFDTLRLSIINKVKQNEELCNYITTEVARSEILNRDGSENLKPRQLSDAIYQDLGKKITGRISDEIWKAIMSDSTNDDITEAVQSVYNRILNPPNTKEVGHHSSPAKDDTSKQNGVSAAPAAADEADMADETELQMPPGFALPNQQSNKVEHKEAHRDHLPHLPSDEELHNAMNMVDDDDDDDMPPGFAIPLTSAGAVTVSHDMNTLAAAAAADIPPGFSNDAGAGSIGGAVIAGVNDEEDDPVVPPGFG